MSDADDYAEWIECWQCGGHGMLAGCVEDTCSCMGDPDDPDECCAPRGCDMCKGKGGWNPEPLPAQQSQDKP